MRAPREDTKQFQIFLPKTLASRLEQLKIDTGVSYRHFFEVAATEALSIPPEQWRESMSRFRPQPKTKAALLEETARLRAEAAEYKRKLEEQLEIHRQFTLTQEVWPEGRH